jgi:hypothetical protein
MIEILIGGYFLAAAFSGSFYFNRTRHPMPAAPIVRTLAMVVGIGFVIHPFLVKHHWGK